MTDSTKPITIYKASAGSGKTFTLAVEYIKLLVLNPQNYRNILAVTFTNKATEEMKTRILGQLYGIGNALPDSEDYMDCMRQAFPKMGDTMIRQRAKEALDLVLHNYHYFKVETIDSFFQRILRNLARELGLTANLTVALNDSEVEERAVDNIIENISGDDDPLLTWVMDFVTEKIDDEKNWNVIGQIKNFGKNIFKDFYKEHQRELRRIMDDPEFFKRYTNKLRAMRAEANKTMGALAAEYRKIVDERLITDKDFFQGGKGVPGYRQDSRRQFHGRQDAQLVCGQSHRGPHLLGQERHRGQSNQSSDNQRDRAALASDGRGARATKRGGKVGRSYIGQHQ